MKVGTTLSGYALLQKKNFIAIFGSHLAQMLSLSQQTDMIAGAVFRFFSGFCHQRINSYHELSQSGISLLLHNKTYIFSTPHNSNSLNKQKTAQRYSGRYAVYISPCGFSEKGLSFSFYGNFKRSGNIHKQLYPCLIVSKLFDGCIEAYFPAIYSNTLVFQCFCNIPRSHGTKKLT